MRPEGEGGGGGLAESNEKKNSVKRKSVANHRFFFKRALDLQPKVPNGNTDSPSIDGDGGGISPVNASRPNRAWRRRPRINRRQTLSPPVPVVMHVLERVEKSSPLLGLDATLSQRFFIT